MKIAISGAANCGKSTLACQLAKALSLPVIDENIEPINQALQSRPRSVADIKKAFQQVLDDKKALEEMQADGFISDRNAIDLFNFLCSFTILVQDNDIYDFYMACKQHTQSYDYVIIPSWGVASYQDLEFYVMNESTPKMNPWINMRRHASIIGLSLMWLPPEKVIVIPGNITNLNEQVAWIVERIGDVVKK